MSKTDGMMKIGTGEYINSRDERRRVNSVNQPNSRYCGFCD